MKLNNVIVTAIVTAGFAIQAWILIEIVNLKVEVAKIEIKMGMSSER
jgi:hypothetical protein